MSSHSSHGAVVNVIESSEPSRLWSWACNSFFENLRNSCTFANPLWSSTWLRSGIGNKRWVWLVMTNHHHRHTHQCILFYYPLTIGSVILIPQPAWWGVLFLQDKQDMDMDYKLIARLLLLPFITEHPERELFHRPALHLSQWALLLTESKLFLWKPLGLNCFYILRLYGTLPFQSCRWPFQVPVACMLATRCNISLFAKFSIPRFSSFLLLKL